MQRLETIIQMGRKELGEYYHNVLAKERLFGTAHEFWGVSQIYLAGDNDCRCILSYNNEHELYDLIMSYTSVEALKHKIVIPKGVDYAKIDLACNRSAEEASIKEIQLEFNNDHVQEIEFKKVLVYNDMSRDIVVNYHKAPICIRKYESDWSDPEDWEGNVRVEYKDPDAEDIRTYHISGSIRFDTVIHRKNDYILPLRGTRFPLFINRVVHGEDFDRFTNSSKKLPENIEDMIVKKCNIHYDFYLKLYEVDNNNAKFIIIPINHNEGNSRKYSSLKMTPAVREWIEDYEKEWMQRFKHHKGKLDTRIIEV